MRDTILKILLYTHIAGGALALLTGAVSILTKKGGKLHRKSGLVFFYSMLAVALSAFIISIVKDIPFLLAISVFSFYLNYTGYRSLKNKTGKYEWYDWGITLLSVLTAAYMIYTTTVVLMVFGALLCLIILRNSYPQFKGEEKIREASKKKVLLHLGNMSGTYIATVTAFLVVNVNFVKPGWLVWLLPTAVGLPFIFYQLKKQAPKQ
jgi:hypothetical protein